MTDLREPLTPADCDLRGLQFMPLFGDRLFASATWIAAKPEAKVAALRLWWHSYSKEVPAASLPDDDALLAEYAGYGVAVSTWRKVRAAALRGWVKCADGRWYHHVVAQLALEAWEGRKENRRDGERKRKEREDRARLFAELAEHDVTPPWNLPTGKLRELHSQTVTGSVTGDVTRHTQNGVTGDVTVTAGKGEGQGQKNTSSLRSDVGPSLPLDAPDEIGLAVEAWNQAAERRGWVKASKLTPVRRQAVRARLREHGLATWRAMLARAESIDWLCDPSKRSAQHANWRPDIDWFARAKTFLKLIEGAYGAGEKAVDWDSAIAIWREHGYWNPNNGPAPNEAGYRGPPVQAAS
jgi:uncharacterized protein YdaU (DUF1376 family)